MALGYKDADNFLFHRSLRKLAGSYKEKGIFDQSIELIQASPQTLLGDFSYFPDQKPPLHKIGTAKNILLYSLVRLKKEKNLGGSCMRNFCKDLKVLYPLAITPKDKKFSNEIREEQWSSIKNKLLKLTLYGQLEDLKSPELISVLFIPNGGFVLRANGFRGQDSELYAFPPLPVGDCCSFLSYLLGFCPHRPWDRFCTYQLEFAYDVLQGKISEKSIPLKDKEIVQELTINYEAVSLQAIQELKPGDLYITRTYKNYEKARSYQGGRGHGRMVLEENVQDTGFCVFGELRRNWNEGFEGIYVSSQPLKLSSDSQDKPYIRAFVLRKNKNAQHLTRS